MRNEQVYCGAAREKITPPKEWLPNLRGLQNAIFEDVLDDIFVRVLALKSGDDTVLIISFDCDKVPCPEELMSAVVQRTGVPEGNISLIATHTHTAPVGGWRENEGPNFILSKPVEVQEQTHVYENFMKERMLKAAEEALVNLVPARIGWNDGESFVNVCRIQDYYVRDDSGNVSIQCGIGKNPSVPVDRKLFVLKVEDMNGKPIAVMMNYSVHNCVLIGNRCGEKGGELISSDLGGNVSQMLEKTFPGMVALWTSGAAGDVNPVMGNEICYPDPETGKQTEWILDPCDRAPIMMLKTLAAQHFDDVMRVLREIRCDMDDCSLCGGVAWAEMPGKGKIFKVRVHLTGIKGRKCLWLAGFSGELLTSLGRAVLSCMPKNSVVINHDASLMGDGGYIFDDETLIRDKEYALPGHGDSIMMPGYINKALEKTVTDLLGKMT